MSSSRIRKKGQGASFGGFAWGGGGKSAPPSLMSVARGIGHPAPAAAHFAHVPLSNLTRAPLPARDNPGFIPQDMPYVPVPPSPTDSSGGGGGGGGDAAPPPPADDSDTTSDAAPQDADAEQPQPTTYADGYAETDYTADATPATDDASPDANYYGDPEVLPKASPFPLVNSFVRNGHLRTLVFLKTDGGITPLTACVPIFGVDVTDGYVRFGSPVQPPGVDGAVMQTQAKLLQEANRERVRVECESLVRRARQGDQNATSILAEMAENAKKGNQRARLAYSFARAYIQKNPASADIGSEGEGVKRLSYWTAVTLANGAPLSLKRVGALAGCFDRPEDVQIFLHGLMNFKEPAKLATVQASLDENKRRILDIGRTVGEARALQMARHPRVPLKQFDKAVAWEFGE